MPKHDHHEPRGPELAKVAQATFEHSGEQWTPMRARVFDVLSGFEKPASAYDIAEVVSKQEGRRIAANTIYRILDLFVIANLARKVESANAYVANAHPDCRHDCIFLVCDSCGETIHLDDDRIGKSVRATAEATGFLPSRPVIEVRGSCVDCIHKAAISTLTH
jgi:Fur family zinc uptake transcriptional regulator